MQVRTELGIEHASLEDILPDLANDWESEEEVIDGLIKNEGLGWALADLLEDWFRRESPPFRVVHIHHMRLFTPLSYTRGEGGQIFVRRLEERR